MNNVIALEEHLQSVDAISAQGNNPQAYRTHVEKLILLLRRKLTEGAIVDVEKVLAQLKKLFDGTRQVRVSISHQLQAEIEMMCIQLRVKTRTPFKRVQHIKDLKQILPKLSQSQRNSVVCKVNCMILYDMDFQGFDKFLQHEDRLAVTLYKKGEFSKSIEIFEKMLRTKLSEYHCMRKVWIGRVLMEAYDLSAFSWLYEVINDSPKSIHSPVNASPSQTFRGQSGEQDGGPKQAVHFQNSQGKERSIPAGVIQKYQAKILFTSGFKVLCQRKGKDPQIAGVRGLREKTIQYLNEVEKMGQTRQQVKKYEKLKLISQQCSEEYKIKNTLEALKSLDNINYFPKPSLQELDLRIKLADLLLKSKLYKEARREAGRCQAIADQLDVLSCQRHSTLKKISDTSFLRMQQASINEMDSQVSEGEQTARILHKVERLTVQESTKPMKRSRQNFRTHLDEDEKKHIILKDKNKIKQLKVENINDLESPEMQFSQEEKEAQKQNTSKAKKGGKTKRLMRNTYQFQRKVHPMDEKKKKELEAEPNCCLLF